METQSEMQQEPGITQNPEGSRKDKVSSDVGSNGEQAGRVQVDVAPGAKVDVSIVPDKKFIEEGAREAAVYLLEATGRQIDFSKLDERGIEILHRMQTDRAGWSESFQADADAALQSLYPDNGGAKMHGPL